MKLFNPQRLLAGVGALIIASSLFPAVANAGSASTDLSVSASVAKSCSITSTPVAFGAYDPMVANRTLPLDTSGSITLTCSKGSSGITLLLGPSTAVLGCTAPQRCMSDGGTNYLDYQLYSDKSGGTVWSTTTALSETVTGGIASPSIVTIYGEIPFGEDVSPLSYTDTILATVNY